MVVLAAPTPSFSYVRLALFVNGFAMIAWAKHVFAYGKEMIRRAEGPRAVEKKTPFDLMILEDLWALGVVRRRNVHLVCQTRPRWRPCSPKSRRDPFQVSSAQRVGWPKIRVRRRDASVPC